MDTFIDFLQKQNNAKVVAPQTAVQDQNTASSEPSSAEGKKSKDAIVEDDLPQINSLKNLLRNGRINKSQFVGSLATLLATGIINKGQFTRLKNGL